HVYVDAGSTATTLLVGLYSDNWGHPDTRLATGTLSSPVAGAWNTVTLTSSPSVTAGTPYWIALLAPNEAGTIGYRDHCCGGGSPAETNAETELSALPETWETGKGLNDGPLA